MIFPKPDSEHEEWLADVRARKESKKGRSAPKPRPPVSEDDRKKTDGSQKDEEADDDDDDDVEEESAEDSDESGSV